MKSVLKYKTNELNNRDVYYFSAQAKNRYRGTLHCNYDQMHDQKTPANNENRPKYRRQVLKNIGKTNSFIMWRDVQDDQDKMVSVKWDVKSNVAEEIMRDLGVTNLYNDENEDECDKICDLVPIHFTYPNISRFGRKSETNTQFHFRSGLSGSGGSNINKHQYLGEEMVLHQRKRGSNRYGIDMTASLPDEVIWTIFSFLPQKHLATCASVCKRWKNIAYDESLWKKVDLKKKYLAAESVGHVIERKVKILRLALAKVELPVFAPNTDFDNVDCKLELLDFSLCSIATEGIEHILYYCFNLKKLSLENCEISDSVCRYIGQNKNLEVLNLCMCSGITATGMLHITNNCKNLRSLNLSWSNLCSYSFDILTMHLTPAICHLNIAGARETLKDTHIAMLGDLCPNLRELDISDGLKLTNASIDIIISKLVLLEHLYTSNCYNICPVKYLQLRQLPYLKKLELFGLFNEDALQQIRLSLPQIEINKQIFSTIARPCTGLSWKMWGVDFKN